MKTILLLLLTIIATTSIAQKDIIVLTNLDTIRCKVTKIKGETIEYKLNEDELTIESKSVYYVLTDSMKRPRYFSRTDEEGNDLAMLINLMKKDKYVQPKDDNSQKDEDVILNTSLVRIMCTLKVPSESHIIYSRAGELDSIPISEVYVVLGRNMTSPKYYNSDGRGKVSSDVLRGQAIHPTNITPLERSPVRSWDAIAGSRLQASGGFMLCSIALGLITTAAISSNQYSNDLVLVTGISSGVCVVISSGLLISAGQALKNK
jgi:hypothetical protein